MNFSWKSSCTKFRKHYIPPYQRLLDRIRKWKPKKLEVEAKLAKLCEEGQLQPFKQPEDYQLHFIHEQIDIQIIDYLFDEAKLTDHYSMDTEDDPFTHELATLQVEFIRYNSSPLVIIIETNYLPEQSTPLFKKIQHLGQIIFSSNNHIYSWGPAKKEIKKFDNFSLFRNIKIVEHNIQDEFSDGELCGLQKAIQYEFNEYLNKTATVGEWGCGIDLLLGTYVPNDVVGSERTYILHEEKKYRSILKEYAINDVFAVTKLSYDMKLIDLLTPPPTIEHEENNYEESIHMQQELSVELKPPSGQLKVHAGDEHPTLNENEFNYNEY